MYQQQLLQLLLLHQLLLLPLLLADLRVNLALQDFNGHTVVHCAVNKHLAGVSLAWLIASDRLLHEDKETVALFEQDILSSSKLDMIDLWTRYKANPQQIQWDCATTVKSSLAMATGLFAVVVLFSDSYLQLRSSEAPRSRSRRFLEMAARLPLELQMVLCHRVYGSMKQNIPTKYSELAFQRLALLCLEDERAASCAPLPKTTATNSRSGSRRGWSWFAAVRRTLRGLF